ncbi:Viral core cysteine proteinase [Eptesipox virus]|uniref:Viral core cysteine proteinase n=1 Tax=Eptesipox virus TaxID=1329402 RepID=A0A220T6B9_9POXV|nr:Viral core cysteine proteinase [Eptesipox virus]ASK51253.1 Viral core cysteine proteinase [Eptesipox virus]WAH71011.1 viral core cysteine proteinase [Eptesipox virus]
MDRYTDLVVSKIPELGFTNLLSYIYSVAGLSSSIDISKFTTNCNGYIIDKFDKSKTAGKIACVPISILLELVDKKILSMPKINNDSVEAEYIIKTELVKDLKKKYNTVEKVFELETSIPIEYFYKPKLREKISKAIDFSQMDLPTDALTKKGFITGVNPKIVKMKIVPEKSAWMSNKSIHKLVTQFAYKSEVDYIGQYDLRFLNSVPIYEKFDTFLHKHVLAYVLKEKISTSTARYVMFGFCYLSHWKCVIFDKQKLIVCFYDSGGNIPSNFHHYNNFYFYSFSDGYNLNEESSELDNSNGDVDVLFRFFMYSFNAKLGCINQEINQLMESECGMFISIFMILCTFTPPNDFKSLRKIYTFFKFLADKKVTLFKSILFNLKDINIDVELVDNDGIREYKKMEAWTKKSITVMYNKITSSINNLLNLNE